MREQLTIEELEVELLAAVQELTDEQLGELKALGEELGGAVGALLWGAELTERARRDGCICLDWEPRPGDFITCPHCGPQDG